MGEEEEQRNRNATNLTNYQILFLDILITAIIMGQICEMRGWVV